MGMLDSSPKKNDGGRQLVLSMYIYWLILVVWQNVGDYIGSSSFALIIKLLLILYLTFNFMNEAVRVRVGSFLLWMGFALYTAILFLRTENALSSSTLIYYCFPVLFSFLTLVCRTDAPINYKNYLLFLKLIIATVAYMALYSVLFKTAYFTRFFALRISYGHELTSFFISNHEYGMYLVFAITATMICYQNTSKRSSHALYLALLVLFAVNLAATLSRTSYLACIVIVAVFVALSKNSSIKRGFLIVSIAIIVLICAVPAVRNFAYTILLKENNDAGRFDMWGAAIEKFREASLAEQLFGHGSSNISAYVKSTFDHDSIHNAFLQVLLVWGITGLCFFIGIIVGSIRSALRILRRDRNTAVIFLALSLSTVAFSMVNTACIMQSPIDSYMLTVFTIIVPRYVANSIEFQAPEIMNSEGRI